VNEKLRTANLPPGDHAQQPRGEDRPPQAGKETGIATQQGRKFAKQVANRQPSHAVPEESVLMARIARENLIGPLPIQYHSHAMLCR
jgi:hypothetical protein